MVELDETGIPKTRLKIFFNKIKPELKLLFFITIVFLLYIGYANQSVPNTQYINVSDPLTVPLTREKILDIYGEIPSDYAQPKSQVRLYEAGDYVPKLGVSPFYLIIYSLMIISVIIFNSNRSDETEHISDERARTIILDRWTYLKKTGKVTGTLDLYNPIPRHHIRTVELDDGRKKPYEIIIAGEKINEDNTKKFVRIGVHPYNEKIMMFLPSDTDFDRGDVCPDCGRFPDTKPITTEDYKELMKIMKGK